MHSTAGNVDILRDELRELGRTQADLCRASGIHYMRLNGAINGLWHLTDDQRNRINTVILRWRAEREQQTAGCTA